MDILIASTDEFFLGVATDLLHADHQITTVSGVSEALDRIEKHRPDVMVVDLELTEINEFDSSRELIETLQSQSIPVLMIAEAVEGVAESDWEDLDIQADEILFKDFKPQSLIQKLNRLGVRGRHDEGGENDRRSCPRLPLDIEVTTRSGEGVLRSPAHNISVGGVYLEIGKPLEKNETVSMRFRIPGGKRTLTLQGEVVWIKELGDGTLFGTGIRFINADPQDLQEIHEYTQTLMKVVKPDGA